MELCLPQLAARFCFCYQKLWLFYLKIGLNTSGKQQSSSIVRSQEVEVSNDEPSAYTDCVRDQELAGYNEIVWLYMMGYTMKFRVDVEQ